MQKKLKMKKNQNLEFDAEEIIKQIQTKFGEKPIVSTKYEEARKSLAETGKASDFLLTKQVQA